MFETCSLEWEWRRPCLYMSRAEGLGGFNVGEFKPGGVQVHGGDGGGAAADAAAAAADAADSHVLPL